MQNAAALPTDIATLQLLVQEQQQMIESLRAHLKSALKRQFGPRNEHVNIDQIGLFASDGSQVIEIPPADEAEDQPTSKTSAGAPRKKALRILKDLPREIRVIDVPESEKTCSCCGKPMHAIGQDCSEQLGYVPASLKIIETRRQKYACRSAPARLSARTTIPRRRWPRAWPRPACWPS